MIIGKTIGMALLLCTLAACDTGPYDPAAHRQAEVSTGSRLSDVDTGIGPNGTNDASLRVNTPGSAGYK